MKYVCMVIVSCGFQFAVEPTCCKAQGPPEARPTGLSVLNERLQAASADLGENKIAPGEFVSRLAELRKEYAGFYEAQLRISTAEIRALRTWNRLHADAASDLLRRALESRQNEASEALVECRLLAQDLWLQQGAVRMDTGDVQGALENFRSIVEFPFGGPGFDSREEQFKAQHLSAARAAVLDYRIGVDDLADFAVLPYAALDVAPTAGVEKARVIKWMPRIQQSYRDVDRALVAQMQDATDADREALTRAREILSARRAQFNQRASELTEQIARESKAEVVTKFPEEVQELLRDMEQRP